MEPGWLLLVSMAFFAYVFVWFLFGRPGRRR